MSTDVYAGDWRPSAPPGGALAGEPNALSFSHFPSRHSLRGSARHFFCPLAACSVHFDALWQHGKSWII